jgi:hypothetical protein
VVEKGEDDQRDHRRPLRNENYRRAPLLGGHDCGAQRLLSQVIEVSVGFIEDDEIGLRRPGSLERLLSGIGPHHRVPAGPQNALERPRRPLLVIGDKDEWSGPGLVSICHCVLAG